MWNLSWKIKKKDVSIVEKTSFIGHEFFLNLIQVPAYKSADNKFMTIPPVVTNIA